MKTDGNFSVYIIESTYPTDFYHGTLDGPVAQSLLNILRIRNRLRMVLDLKHLKKAFREANRDKFDVMHLSCHGDENGIDLAKDRELDWPEFTELFQESSLVPKALIMSSCCGAASGIGQAFAKVPQRPLIIFGSVDRRSYGEYATAWTLLYHRFKASGVTRGAAQVVLQQINAAVSRKFLYRRWDAEQKKYLSYPRRGVRYEVQEASRATRTRRK